MRPFEYASDLWDTLRRTDRPIVVYGMGNGADKLFDRLADIGCAVRAVVASDGFVRGQSFRGMRVMPLSEARTQYPDAVCLIAFGTRLPSVLASLDELRRTWTVYVPDMPVCDALFFDLAFCRAHAEELAAAAECFFDALSRDLFSSLVHYKLTGEWDALMAHTTPASDIYRLIGEDITCAMDLGAYRGDTVAEMIEHFPRLSRVIAVEPDRRNFGKLSAYAAGTAFPVIEAHRAAVADTEGEAVFYGSGNRNASLAATSHAYREESIPLATVDGLSADATPDYIKYDVEGAEARALLGSARTIARARPILRVSAYHRSEDLYRLPLLLKELCPSYRMYLRRTPCIPAWEADILCIPEERSRGV